MKEVDISFKGKHALVTGSSRGIGLGIVQKLVEAPLWPSTISRTRPLPTRPSPRCASAARSLGILADVSRPEEISRMFERVRKGQGGLDIFVSNARSQLPTFYRKPLVDNSRGQLPLAAWRRALAGLWQ